jgi:Ca2+-binding RTX toxin-like protein
MYGGAGNDGFFGGGENDRIFGEDGNDTIYGDGGNDVIRGGRGNDMMSGGQAKDGFSLGNDTFAWSLADVLNPDGTSAGFDRIADFGAGDRLDFSGLFSGKHPSAAGVVHVTDTGEGTVIAVDLGAGQPTEIVLLEGVHDLTVADLTGQGSLIV